MLPVPGSHFDYPVPYFGHEELTISDQSGNYDVDLPAGRATGDMCVISVLVSEENRTITPDNGFVQDVILPGGFPNGCSVFQFHKRLDGTEPATLSWATNFATSYGIVTSLVLVRGNTGKHDHALINANNTSAISTPALSVTTDRFRFVAFLCTGHINNANINSFSNQLNLINNWQRQTAGDPDTTVAHAGKVGKETSIDQLTGFVASESRNNSGTTVAVW